MPVRNPSGSALNDERGPDVDDGLTWCMFAEVTWLSPTPQNTLSAAETIAEDSHETSASLH